MINSSEYDICRRRGHEPSEVAVTYGMGPTWLRCRWCGAEYRWTDPEMVEREGQDEAEEER